MSLDKLKKGDKVILHMFTGIPVNCTEIIACNDKFITIQKKDETKVKFSRKTGKQVEPKVKNDRFANYITEDDGSYDPNNRTYAKKKKPVKKAKAAPKKPVVDEDDEDEDEAPAPKKAKASKKASKKAPAKKASKKAKPEPEEDEEIDEEEYEEE